MKPRNLFNAAFIILSLSIVSCNSGTEDETATVNTTDSFKVSPVDQYINASADSMGTTATQPASQAIQQNANMAIAPTLNPAHGQPGHVCEVEVGAPLPASGSAKASAAPTTKPATITTNTAQPAPSKNTAGLNPAHGEPGHKCEIAVGAPLNSAPTSAAPTAAPTSAPVNSAPIQLPKANAGNAKLNPAHGAPGHDCAVPVGQPLKN